MGKYACPWPAPRKKTRASVLARATRPWSSLGRRPGFTLVEVAAVTLVLALLAAGVALSFAGPIRSMRAGDAVERVRSFDATARLTARRSGRAVQMTFAESDGTLVRRDDPDGLDGGPVAYRGTMPGGYRVERFRSAGDDRDDAAGMGRGRSEVRCSPAGLSRTYAVRVVGPGLDKWLVFAGLTGQVTEARDEADVDAIFGAARLPSGRD